MTDDDIIQDAKKFLELCQTLDGANRLEALEDLRFRKGDQWDDRSARQRELDGRPCLTINNIPSIIHQVTNDVRQNQQSIHVHPSDADASDEVAEIIEGLCRHIEYESGADAAYDTAVDYAASIGFGYFRLVTEYCDPMSFEQDMRIKRIRNPFTVYMDPASEEADGSDSKRAMISLKLPKDVFKRDYPKAKPDAGFQLGAGDNRNWADDTFTRVAEFYRIEEQTETLVLLNNGRTILATDKRPLPFGVLPVKTRDTTTHKVMWYKITAFEVLEKAEIPFDWIPIFPVYGDEIDLDGRVIRTGLIRYAKDPKRMENFWVTAATEEIALRTKTPFIGALGQFAGVEDDWAAANNRSFAYLEYNPVTIEGNLAPPPTRQAPADVPTGYIAMAGIARDNVKAVTGIFDASLGNRSNETSGVAINSRKRQGEVANFHFADNLGRAIRHLGRCIVSGIPKVYDTQRLLRIVGEDGSHENVEVNKQEQDETGQAAERVVNDMTVGRYAVIVTSGPSYNSLREEAAASMIELGGKWPPLMQFAGPKVIRAMDWPGAQDIADDVAKGLGIKEGDEEEGMVQTPNGPIPADQAGQLIGQMNHTLEQMQAEMEDLESGIKAKQIDADARVRVAEISAQSSHDNTELKGMIDMILAKMDAMQVIQASEVQHGHDLQISQQDAALGMAQAEHQQEIQPEPEAGTSATATQGKSA